MAGTSSFRKHNIFPAAAKVALVLLAFITLFSSLTGVLLSQKQKVSASDGGEINMAADFAPPFDLPAALVFNAADRPLLYKHNADISLEIPAVSRLMALLVSADRLGPEDMISISKQAEKLAKDELNTSFELKSGMDLPYRYLVLRMLMQNSDAAALAIAEHLFGDEQSFLKIMDQRASELGMINSKFYTLLTSQAEHQNPPSPIFTDPEIDWSNLTFEKDSNQGLQILIDGQPVPGIVPNYENTEVFTATSSLLDLSRLAQALYASRSAIDYLRVTEELVSVRSDTGDRVIPIRSNIARLFTLSEGKVEAAYHHSSNRFSLSLSFGITTNDIPVTTLLLSTDQSLMIDENLKLYDSIDQFYQITPLTQAGSLVPGRSETAESGVSFNLQYLDTVYYVHPKDNFYLNDDVIYVGNAPYLLPLQQGSMTGLIIFEMLDGTRIPVRVGPDRDIISSNTIFARLVTQLYNNENLGRMIIGLAILICLILTILLIREIIKLFYWRRMRRLEQAGNPKK